MSESGMADHIVSRSEQNGVTIATLTNGMKVIIKEDHRTPVVICHVWVRVGSNREPDNLRGWAHGIEHMVFKGTVRRAESDFAHEVAAAGGTTNAGTGYETTSYHVLVPRENLPCALDILADALFNAAFEPSSLDAERQVLVHENHMYDDIPYGFGITWRWGMEMAYTRSPYRHPIGGRDEELLSAPRDDIKKFHRTAYRPDNMTAVVVGDVTADEVIRQLKDSFAGVSATGGPKLPVPPREPVQNGVRYRLAQGDLQKAYAKLVFPAISERDPDRPVLSVVRRILADGRSCRLYRTVQEERQLVSDITFLTESGPREGVVLIDLETNSGQIREAVGAVAELLQELRTTPPSEEELRRAKIRVERSFLFSAETVQGQSSTIGYYDAMGDLEGAFCFPDRVNTVTGADVTRFCRRIFRRGNLNVLFYVPSTADLEAADLPTDTTALEAWLAPLLGDEAVADTSGTIPGPAAVASGASSGAPCVTPSATPDAGNTARSVRGAGASAAPAADFDTAHLATGLPVYLRVDRTLPVFTLGLYTTGGVCLEERVRAGLSSLTHKVQVKGTDDADAERIHNAIEGLGASLFPHADRDYGGLYLAGLSRNLDPVLTWLGRLACSPSFPEDELQRERKLALDQLASLADDPFQQAARLLRETLYTAHPYGYPVVGHEDSLPSLTRADLVRMHRRIWVPANLYVVVSGDLEPELLLSRLDEVLSDLPAGEVPLLPALDNVPAPDGVVRKCVRRDFHQSVVFVAWPGPADPNCDRAELMLLKELLNGQSGRLFEALRNRRSLCYNTGLLSTAGFGPGLVAAYVLTDPATEEKALAALRDELHEVAATEAMAEEFERARAKLTGNLLITSQSNTARVNRCAGGILYGRGPNDLDNLLGQIAACTPRAVRETAARYLSSPDRLEIILGPDEGAS